MLFHCKPAPLAIPPAAQERPTDGKKQTGHHQESFVSHAWRGGRSPFRASMEACSTTSVTKKLRIVNTNIANESNRHTNRNARHAVRMNRFQAIRLLYTSMDLAPAGNSHRPTRSPTHPTPWFPW